MCNFPPDEEEEEKQMVTITVDNYVGRIQDAKRNIAEECIEVK